MTSQLKEKGTSSLNLLLMLVGMLALVFIFTEALPSFFKWAEKPLPGIQ